MEACELEQPGFQDLGLVELVKLHVPDGGICQSILRDEPHQFTVMDSHSISLRFTPDRFHDARDRRLTEVGEVHRDLGASLDEQTQVL